MTPSNSEWNWDAISAVATVAASVIALGASALAIYLPARLRKLERYEATKEVLSAIREAIAIYWDTRGFVFSDGQWNDEKVRSAQIKSHHLHEALNRLISRPNLAEGAIVVGAGAMSLLIAIIGIETTEEIRRRKMSSPNLSEIERVGARFISAVSPARDALDAAAETVTIVTQRADTLRVGNTFGLWRKRRSGPRLMFRSAKTQNGAS